MNGRMPLYLTLLLAAVLSAAMLLVQPYSGRGGDTSSSPWDVYTEPAQRFLEAAVEKDSLALLRQSTNIAPVAWALAAARNKPDFLRVWAREAWVWAGSRHGDTTEVLYATYSDICADQPVWLRFVEARDEARVVAAGSACFSQR
jgi:hypothetical protein